MQQARPQVPGQVGIRTSFFIVTDFLFQCLVNVFSADAIGAAAAAATTTAIFYWTAASTTTAAAARITSSCPTACR